jgi:nucleotide-binding universal stress UspA family protein
MRTVVAALDASAAARPVLEAACRTAGLTGSTVEAVHVGRATSTVTLLAARYEVPLHLLAGPVEDALLARIHADDVVTAVIGARRSSSSDRHPAGHTALEVLERSRRPVVVVPPDLPCPQPRPWHRLLLPLEGDNRSSQPVLDALRGLVTAEVEPVVLHVFTNATAPPMLDRPSRDLALWAAEFGARYGPPGASVECRSGAVADQVARGCDAEHADLVVLSWSQAMTPGHAAVVREVLTRAAIPVLLLPVAPA